MIAAAERDPDDRDRERNRLARISRDRYASVAEVGEHGEVANPLRKAMCRDDLHLFLVSYFPNSTGLKLFSQDHLQVIERIQKCIAEGGRFVQAVYRGFAKTTISENSAIWAALYGHRSFVPVFAADASAAAGIIDSIKVELSENDLLAEDFPEVCHYVRALEGKPQRCASQTANGKLTHIEWTAEQIVLPAVDGSVASGCIITARGLTAASRGMKYKRPDGTQQRPDFVIIDDPQTDESANTELQVKKRLKVIRKSILRSGGHNRKIAVVMNATVIKHNDLVDQLLNPKLNPSWQGERIKMVRKWPDRHADLWMEEYKRIRESYDSDIPGDQARAHADATEFYREHRAEMDAGAIVSWEHCYDEDSELSSVQHAYNILIDDGPEVFASECQNEPELEEEQKDDLPSSAELAKRVDGRGRGIVPLAAHCVTGFIDCHQDLLYWKVCAFGRGFTGGVVDYGTYPKQDERYFTLKGAKRTIADIHKNMGPEGQLTAALDALLTELLTRTWPNESGTPISLSMCLVDANWGDMRDVVYEVCRRHQHSARILPSHGKYFGAMTKPMAEWEKRPGDRIGMNWRITAGLKKEQHVLFDTNWWKSFLFARLMTAKGDSGAVTLFGTQPEIHELLCDSLKAEHRTKVTAKGRTIWEWKPNPDKPDNHYLDTFVGCCVAASIQEIGLILNGVQAGIKPERKRLKLSEIQAARR